MTLRLPNRIATSVYTLPTALAAGLLLWLLRGWGSAGWPFFTGVALAAVTTYAVMELNNRYMLIRVHTRLTSSLFWLGLAVLTPVGQLSTPAFPMAVACALCLVVAFYLLFSTYDRRDRVLTVFHTFILLGVATLLHPMLSLCIPMFWMHLVIYMRSMTLRVFCASQLGLSLVAVVCAALQYCGLMTSLDFAEAFSFSDWTMPSPSLWLMLGAGLVSLGSFMMRNYDDKIQVRMMHYVLLLQWIALMLMSLISASDLDIPHSPLPTPHSTLHSPHSTFPSLQPSLWLVTSSLAANQFATSRSFLTTLWFWLLAAGAVALLVTSCC